MQRTPEPELMDDPAQAAAYAQADFAEPHQQFVALAGAAFPGPDTGAVLDLGCGPADVTIRYARAHPDCRVDGIDASAAMLAEGRRAVAAAGLAARITLVEGYLPGAQVPRAPYATLISNSLLHHLPDPQVLWQALRRYGAPGARVFVMDLRRPDSAAAVDALVARHAADAPPVLRADFRNSLHAAYTVDEVAAQLAAAGLGGFAVTAVGDRHLTLHGTLD